MKKNIINNQASPKSSKEKSIIKNTSHLQHSSDNLQKHRQITDGEIRWLSKLKPMTTDFIRLLSGKSFQGRKIACRMHMVWNFIPVIEAFKKAGADIFCTSCSPHSVDMGTVRYLEAKGIQTHILDQSNYSIDADKKCMDDVLNFEPEIICDMGGELIERAIMQKQTSVIGALEATKSGIATIENCLRNHSDLKLSFPVFNWNDIDIKNRLENRFHVGEQVWPVFNTLTRMSLIQKKILVIGGGPVGFGIADRALRLGGRVTVFDCNPTVCLEATYMGCATAVSIEDALKSADIIVTATGSKKVIGQKHMPHIKDGAILFNVGHFNQEIDMDFFHSQPSEDILPHLKLYRVQGKEVFILADGNLLNLANSDTVLAADIFDAYTTIVAAGTEWLLEDGQSSYEHKIHLYPPHLEQKVAHLSLKHIA